MISWRNFMKNLFFRFSAIILTGFLAGVVNGLFGTGGGIFIVFLFSQIYALGCVGQADLKKETSGFSFF